MSIAITRTGDELLEFHPGSLLRIPAALAHLPLEFAVVVARHRGQVLFAYNPWRQEWELPAGLIEPGESPQEAAQRELAEETGQVTHSLRYAGICLLRLARTGALEMGAAYTGEIDVVQPFQANDEIARMMFWDLGRAVEGYVNALGAAIAKLVIDTSPGQQA